MNRERTREIGADSNFKGHQQDTSVRIVTSVATSSFAVTFRFVNNILAANPTLAFQSSSRLAHYSKMPAKAGANSDRGR